MNNQNGFLGIRAIVILAVVLGVGIWAYCQGYLKWKGPGAAGVVEEMKDDANAAVKKLKK